MNTTRRGFIAALAAALGALGFGKKEIQNPAPVSKPRPLAGLSSRLSSESGIATNYNWFERDPKSYFDTPEYKAEMDAALNRLADDIEKAYLGIL